MCLEFTKITLKLSQKYRLLDYYVIKTGLALEDMFANRQVYLLVNIIYLQSYHQTGIGRLIIVIAVQVQIIHCKFSGTSNSYSPVWMVTDTVCTGHCLMPLLQTSHVLTFTVSIRWDNKRQFVISFFFYFTTKFLWDPKSDLGKLTVIKNSQHIK